MNEIATDQSAKTDDSPSPTTHIDNEERPIDEQMRRLVCRLGELIGRVLADEDRPEPEHK